jgi:hypothetical protein
MPQGSVEIEDAVLLLLLLAMVVCAVMEVWP